MNPDRSITCWCARLLAIGCAFFVVYGVGILLLRAFVPVQLGIFEGKTLCQAVQVAEGGKLYRDPAVHGAADIYTPLYPLLMSIVYRAAVPSFLWGRLASLALTLLAGGLLTRYFLRRQGGLAVAMLFAAMFTSIAWQTEWFFAAFKSDILCHVLWVAAYVLLLRRGIAATCSAGALLALAFFAKQTAVFALPGAVIFLLLDRRRDLLVLLVASAVAFAGCFVVFRHLAGDWMAFYIFGRMKIQAGHGYSISELMHYAFLFRRTPVMLVGVAFALFHVRDLWGDRSFRLALLAAPFFFGGSVLTAASEGGDTNSLIPAFIALSFVAAIGYERMFAATGELRAIAAGVALVLLPFQWDSWAPYNISKARGRFDTAFTQIVEFLEAQEGSMYCPSHNVITLLAGHREFDDRGLARYIEPLNSVAMDRIRGKINSGVYDWLILDSHEKDQEMMTDATQSRYALVETYGDWLVYRNQALRKASDPES